LNATLEVNVESGNGATGFLSFLRQQPICKAAKQTDITKNNVRFRDSFTRSPNDFKRLIYLKGIVTLEGKKQKKFLAS
jgi:hypothetical protein